MGNVLVGLVATGHDFRPGNYGTIGTTFLSGEVPGFIPRSANVGISYINRGWTLRAQYNYNGRALGNTLNANPALRQYNYSKRRVDFNASYALSSKLTLFADVINALSDTLGDNPYIYIPARKRGADLFSAEIKAGVSGRFQDRSEIALWQGEPGHLLPRQVPQPNPNHFTGGNGGSRENP